MTNPAWHSVDRPLKEGSAERVVSELRAPDGTVLARVTFLHISFNAYAGGKRDGGYSYGFQAERAARRLLKVAAKRKTGMARAEELMAALDSNPAFKPGTYNSDGTPLDSVAQEHVRTEEARGAK